MNRINSDRERILKCIEDEGLHYTFPSIDRECLSYFETYDMEKESAIEEFRFSTIPELQLLLGRKRVVNTPAIDLACAIVVYKNKPHTEQKKVEESLEQYTIPTYIYTL